MNDSVCGKDKDGYNSWQTLDLSLNLMYKKKKKLFPINFDLR